MECTRQYERVAALKLSSSSSEFCLFILVSNGLTGGNPGFKIHQRYQKAATMRNMLFANDPFRQRRLA